LSRSVAGFRFTRTKPTNKTERLENNMASARLNASRKEAASMEIGKVYVTKRADRGVFFLRWLDPKTQKAVVRKTDHRIAGGKKAKAEADRDASKQERELFEGRYVNAKDIGWEDFVLRCNQEPLKGQADKTAKRANLVLNKVTKTLKPKYPSSITAERLSVLVSVWRDADVKESTIKSYLGQLRSILSWAKSINIIGNVPTFPKIVQAKRQLGSTPHKGRGITAEELDRMKAAVDTVFVDKKKNGKVIKCRSKDRNAWKQYLEGLWLSGLRLEESFALSWEEGSPVQVVVVGKGRRKVARLFIEAEAQKNKETILLPLTPDFSKWLLATPEGQRVGKVFSFPGERNGQIQTGEAVGKLVSKLGKKAGVVVAREKGKASKFASAHDLRRSFGDRWAGKVMPPILRQLMRHKSSDTTDRYYVGKQASDVEAACLEAERNVDESEKLPKSYQETF
jgi:integrase